MHNILLSLSPLDGRYKSKTDELSDYFSEFALFKYRVRVEIEWLIFLCNEIKIKKSRVLDKEEIQLLQDIANYFDVVAAEKVKQIEGETNHDVKAVEYYIKESLSDTSMADISELVHFGCTSEDINNTAYALMLMESRSLMVENHLRKLTDSLRELAYTHASQPMLSLTHGQTASPTTLGKELANVAARLEYFYGKLMTHEFTGKFNGATGNFNAHVAADSKLDWIDISQKFLTHLGLKPNLMTTQIEPHDNTAEYLLTFSQVNTILIDFSRDIWQYVSRGIFKQKLKEGEVGSSTMPHKVNPIDFENAEGNLGLANSTIYHLAQKLPISRMQRDLSDSTVFRNLGVSFGYSLIAFKSLQKGISKLELNPDALITELQNNPEVLAEAIQTVMRMEKIDQPYEKLKQLTRGKKITQKEIEKFVEKLELSDKAKNSLLKLTPENYIGLAEVLTQQFLKDKL